MASTTSHAFSALVFMAAIASASIGFGGDTVGPSPTLSGPASPTYASPFRIQIDWNEPVAGFDLSDLALTNATASNLQPRMTAATAALWQMHYCPATASLGTKVFFGGGGKAGTVPDWGRSSVVDIYDSASGTWSIDWLSQPRDNLAAASAGTKVLFGGGYLGPDLDGSSRVDIYDSANGEWSTAELSQGRYELAAASVGTKVFFGGGIAGWSGAAGTIPSNVVDIYDSASGTWSTAALSEPRYDLAAASAGTKVLFAGGNWGSGTSNRVDIYDSVSGTWSTATLSQARMGLAAASVGTKVLFAGGASGSGASNVVDIYDSANDTWSTAALSEPRGWLAAASVGTKALFGGGESNWDNMCNAVDIYCRGH